MRCSQLALFVYVWHAMGQLQVIHGSDGTGSVPTSTAGMLSLLDVEAELLQNLENYINVFEQRAQRMRQAFDSMRAENVAAKVNVDEYLANPLNGFSLIRRLHDDWIKWELFMGETLGTEQVEFIRSKRDQLPDKSDLWEAVQAMYRLQVTYDLNPLDMSRGFLNGKQYDVKLSSFNCFRIGSELYKDHLSASSHWLYTALQSYDPHSIDVNLIHRFNKLKILELYSKTMQRQNRLNDSLLLIEAGLSQFPTDATFLNYRLEIEERIRTGYVHKEDTQPTYYPENRYKLGCQGRFETTPPRLHCLYNATTNAFLRLAPLKMELVHLDPYMVIYHDVISAKEIEMLKSLALPQLKRATVYDAETQKSVVTKTRTSQFAWFPNDSNNVTLRINQRISDMTGLTMMNSEMLQAMNYGLGGHYDTHYDYFEMLDTDAAGQDTRGNRIATVLFYLSDVEQGGGTVFPLLKTLVLPKKGSAIIWYNLNNKGDGDTKTLHAACPVIVGSKWVCNKWIRAREQAFFKPCYKE